MAALFHHQILTSVTVNPFIAITPGSNGTVRSFTIKETQLSSTTKILVCINFAVVLAGLSGCNSAPAPPPPAPQAHMVPPTNPAVRTRQSYNRPMPMNSSGG